MSLWVERLLFPPLDFGGASTEVSRRDCLQFSAGAVSAMARVVLEEWRLAYSMEEFRIWLERGAPSDDAKDEKPRGRASS